MDKKFGLTTEEVRLSAEKYGKNSLREREEDSLGRGYGKDLGKPIMHIFIGALAVYIVFSVLGGQRIYEAVAIGVGLFVLIYLSSYFEKRNKQILGSLKKRSSRTMCRVFREGILGDIYIDEIVVGDAVLLLKGDIVPADGIILEGELELDESPLSREGSRVKRADISRARAMEEEEVVSIYSEDMRLERQRVFRGSVVCEGKAVFRVTAVGEKTVLGRILPETSPNEEDKRSPLNLRLFDLSRRISSMGSIGAIIIAAYMVFRRLFVSNNFYMYSVYAYMSETNVFVTDLMMAVMLACGVILICTPERVNYIISYVVSRNTKRLLKDNVLVKRLKGLEEAGTQGLIIADKTGIFTVGEPECVIFIDGVNKVYTHISDLAEGLRAVLVKSVLGNTSGFFTGGGKEEFSFCGGNGWERAMARFVAQGYEGDIPRRIREIPFDSNVKMSAATLEDSERGSITLIKGIPENIIERCGYYYAENGKKLLLGNSAKEELANKIERLYAKGIGVMVFATSDEPIYDGQIPMYGNWALLGVAGIRDEVRPEAVQSLRELQSAGVQTIMVTGDGVELSKGFAEEIGLCLWEEHKILNAEDMASMTDNEIKAVFPDIRVIARASVKEKRRILTIAKSMDMVVGLTGSTVEDMEDMAVADVGFVPEAGHGAVKAAADIVLLDNSIASIVKSVLYGRTFFYSIRKFMAYKLTVIFSVILVMLLIPSLGKEMPLTALHLIWINIIVNILGLALFAGEAPMKKYLREKPKSRRQKIITRRMLYGAVAGVCWCGFVGVMLFMLPPLTGLFRSNEALLCGYTACFVLTQVFVALNVRTEGSNLMGGALQSNEFFAKGLWIICIVQLIIVYLGGEVFRSTPLNLWEWIAVLGGAVLIIPMDIIRKHIYGNPAEEAEEVDVSVLLMEVDSVSEDKVAISEEIAEEPSEDTGYDEEPFEEEDDGQPDTIFEDIGDIGEKTLEEVISEYEAFEGEARMEDVTHELSMEEESVAEEAYEDNDLEESVSVDEAHMEEIIPVDETEEKEE